MQVIGPSMFPTLSATGDLLLLERLSTRFQKVKAGDIVMACSPENPRLTVCKRVLALEGDKIMVLPAPNCKDDVKHVLVCLLWGHIHTAAELPASRLRSVKYLMKAQHVYIWPHYPILFVNVLVSILCYQYPWWLICGPTLMQVPKGHVWLEGDNPSHSRDSRHYGPVPYALLQGKVCLRVRQPFHML